MTLAHHVVFLCFLGFKLSVSWSRNAIYFSVKATQEKSHFTIFVIQNFVQKTQKHLWIHLYYWDQVFKVNEWCLMNCFHRESSVSNQIVTLLLPREMQTFSACGSLSFTIQNIYVNSNPVFLNLFNFQERKTRYWNEIRRSWLEIYLETKHTKSRARINTRAIALSRFLFKFLFEI